MIFFRLGIPFVRFLLVFSIGILSGEYSETILPVSGLWILWLILWLLYWIRRKIPSFIIVSGSYLFLLYAGNQVVYRYYEHNETTHYSHTLSSTDCYVARIGGVPEPRQNSLKVLLEVEQLRRKGATAWEQASGKLIAYLPLADTARLYWGDCLLIKGAPSARQDPLNPGQFDYTRYLRRKNIDATHFITTANYHRCSHTPPSGIFALAASFRKQCESILRKEILAPDEYQIAVALVLGMQTELDEQLLQAYSDSGTIHALAVSGMHVSLVYLIITYSLGFIKRFSGGKIIFPALSLCLLWFYAMVTGFSPSVVRAVTMFSVFILAGVFRRNANTYNALAFSAFVILCVQPLWLLDIGFQFSFMAVLGIVGIHPVLHRSFAPENYFIKSGWSLVSVSLAAQAAVAPLSIYYFHSFPVLFLAYNLLIVPISSLALYTGLATLIFFKIDFLAKVSATLTFYLLRGMNEIVCFPVPEVLQKAEHLYLTRIEVGLLYAILFAITYSVHAKSYRWFCATAGLSCLYLASALYNDCKASRQCFAAVYYVKRESVVALVGKGHAVVLSDSLMHHTDKIYRYAVYNHLVETGVKQVRFTTFEEPSGLAYHKDDESTTIVWQQKTIVRRRKRVGNATGNKQADIVLDRVPAKPYMLE